MTNVKSPRKPPTDTQPADQSSFGHPLGEDHGQQGTPLEGELPDGSRPKTADRLAIDKGNAIEGQTHAKRHNSGSRSGQD